MIAFVFSIGQKRSLLSISRAVPLKTKRHIEFRAVRLVKQDQSIEGERFGCSLFLLITTSISIAHSKVIQLPKTEAETSLDLLHESFALALRRGNKRF